MGLLNLMYIFGIFARIVSSSTIVGEEEGKGNGTAPLGDIQKSIEILQGNVLTLTKLVTVLNQKVDTNTRTVTTLNEKLDTTIKSVEKMDLKVDANSKALLSLKKKVDSTSGSINSLKKDIDSKFESAERKVNSKFDSAETKVNSKISAVGKKFDSEMSAAGKKIDSKFTKVDVTVTQINHAVESNQKSLISFTGSCNILPDDICGPCTCRDDSRLLENHYCDCSHLPAKRDCQQFRLEGAKITGIYTIHQNNLRIIRVFCDQQTDGGGWTVFQRRIDGSEKFYRDWENYRVGFGSLQNEFWLGNRNLYTLTSQGIMGNELRVEIGDWFGVRKFAKYSRFQIGSDIAKFQLNVAGYSGNAGDSLSYHNGHEFSTYDNDNDSWNGNCAISYMGAWWYYAGYGYDSNLNAVYYDYGQMGSTWTGIHWRKWHDDGDFSFKFAEMKTRRKV